MIEEGSVFDVVYTDFAKAFDSATYERLSMKLEAIGIQGDILSWIRSFASLKRGFLKSFCNEISNEDRSLSRGTEDYD